MNDWNEQERAKLVELMVITRAQTIAVLNHFGVADLLRDGPRSVDDLSKRSGAHELTLYRLLRFAASYGVFTEVEPKRFALTPMASWLRSDAPRSLFWRVEGDTLVRPWLPWDEWIETAMTGEPAYDRMHGRSYWEALTSDASAREAFDGNIRFIAEQQIPAVVPHLDLRHRRHVVDVGCGWAGWLVAILASHPDLTGTALDLAQAAPAANATLDAAALGSRAAFVAGDFFEDVPSGDVMLLGNVLHDWDDERAALVLQRCAEALESGGIVIAVDRVLPEGDTRHHGKAVDINMLFMLGGRERTESEFRQLFDRAGLSLTGVTPTETDVSILTAVPATTA